VPVFCLKCALLFYCVVFRIFLDRESGRDSEAERGGEGDAGVGNLKPLFSFLNRLRA
jgi:hypothetical protein